MLARAKNWIKVNHTWVRAGEEFHIDESQLDQVAGMVEIIEADSSPADEPPVPAVDSEPAKTEPAKKPRTKKSSKKD